MLGKDIPEGLRNFFLTSYNEKEDTMMISLDLFTALEQICQNDVTVMSRLYGE